MQVFKKKKKKIVDKKYINKYINKIGLKMMKVNTNIFPSQK